MHVINTLLSNEKFAAMFQVFAKDVSKISGLDVSGRQLEGDKLLGVCTPQIRSLGLTFITPISRARRTPSRTG